MSATIAFAKNHQREIIYFPYGSQLNAIEAFADQLAAYSHCGIEFCTCTQRRVLDGYDETPGDFEGIGMFAKILMRNQADGKLYAVMIPAPNYSIFEAIPGQGFKVKASIGNQITAYYAAMSGEILVYHDGWLVGNTL